VQALSRIPELHDLVDVVVRVRLLEPVHVYSVNKPGIKQVVQRPLLLDSGDSHAALQLFLKPQQLGIPREQQVKVAWSEEGEPGGK
jgi:hypothetical protein